MIFLVLKSSFLLSGASLSSYTACFSNRQFRSFRRMLAVKGWQLRDFLIPENSA
jgi:hypothetical protein